MKPITLSRWFRRRKKDSEPWVHGCVVSWGVVLTDQEVKALADGADPRTVRPEALVFVDGKRVSGEDLG